jgi:hypothetical protein
MGIRPQENRKNNIQAHFKDFEISRLSLLSLRGEEKFYNFTNPDYEDSVPDILRKFHFEKIFGSYYFKSAGISVLIDENGIAQIDFHPLNVSYCFKENPNIILTLGYCGLKNFMYAMGHTRNSTDIILTGSTNLEMARICLHIGFKVTIVDEDNHEFFDKVEFKKYTDSLELEYFDGSKRLQKLLYQVTGSTLEVAQKLERYKSVGQKLINNFNELEFQLLFKDRNSS